MTTIRTVVVACVMLSGMCQLGHAASWGLWNSPGAVDAGAREERALQEETVAAERRAEATRKAAIEALQQFEEARRAAQQAEAERLKLVQEAKEREDLERLRRLAAEEKAGAEADRQQQELAKLKGAAAREQETAELERLKAMAAAEKKAAGIPAAAVATRPAPAPRQHGSMPGSGDDYQIGPGDVIDIAAWRDEALSRTVVVAPDGTIAFPLVGKLDVQGQTLPQLKYALERELEKYIAEPVLSVELKQANSLQIYVIGKVNSPGRFLIGSSINVLQALAMAGGPNPFADEDDIRVMRENGQGTETFEFDYRKVLRGKNTAQNIKLQRGDVVVVP